MSYTLPPSITFYEKGGSISGAWTLTTVSTGYDMGRLIMPSGIQDRITSAFVDLIIRNIQETSGNINYIDSAAYLRLIDLTTMATKTVYTDLSDSLYCQANQEFYYGRIYGNNDIGSGWLVDGRTYEIDLMTCAVLHNNIKISNFQPVFRMVLR